MTTRRIGVADVRLATSAARGVDALELARCVTDAIELGITLVETSEEPEAERLVGDAVRTQRARDRVTVATRVPPLAAVRDTLPDRLPVGYLQERVEASLRATRLDVLPLVQLPLRPAWLASRAWAELAGTCARLVREGKVLAWAAALDDARVDADAKVPGPLVLPTPAAEDPHAWARGPDAAPAPIVPLVAGLAINALIAEPWLSALALPYSLCDRGAEPLIIAATKRELTVLARRPLAGGALAGSLGPGVKLRRDDDRRTMDLERVAVGVARLARFVKQEPPAVRAGEAARAAFDQAPRREPACSTLAELALRYLLDHGAVPLVRLHRHEHLAGVIALVAAPPLDRDLIDALPRDI